MQRLLNGRWFRKVRGRKFFASSAMAVLFLPAFLAASVQASPSYNPYSQRLCTQQLEISQLYECVRVERDASWTSLIPDKARRQRAQKLNRQNRGLRADQWVAIPVMQNVGWGRFSPLPLSAHAGHEALLVFAPADKAWGFYQNGRLQAWRKLLQ